MRSAPLHPVYIPSKGRWQLDRALTVRALQRDGVPFRVVVEPQEVDQYWPLAGENVLTLPFRDLGMGSIPARNWIRDHAESEGHAKHHQLDDNIYCFYRLWKGRRVPVHAGVALRVCEDFADRFENVGIAGLAYDMFVIPFGGSGIRSPYFKNVHCYSHVLIDHGMPYRHRGRYNEDTDLCLQALVHGWATLLVNAITIKKVTTQTMGGGNTDSIYDGMDGAASASDTMGRFEMAHALEKAWPGLVKLTRRYGRYQHSVDWSRFANVPLRLREGLDLSSLPEVDEYGMSLRAVREVRSDRVRRLLEEYEAVRDATPAADPYWRGLPAFHPTERPPKLKLQFRTEEDREKLVEQLGVTVDKRFTTGKAWSAWHPPRGRDDPASLRFEPEQEEAKWTYGK